MPTDTLPLPQGLPRFGRIADGMHRSGLSRAALYNLVGEHPGLFLKCGHATILNLEMLDEIMASLPPAVITPRNQRRTTSLASNHK